MPCLLQFQKWKPTSTLVYNSIGRLLEIKVTLGELSGQFLPVLHGSSV
jgi:hypothetical protein